MKVITIDGREFLSTDNTLEPLGEKGGVFFFVYYIPTRYYQAAMFNREGKSLDNSGITLYDIEDLLENI